MPMQPIMFDGDSRTMLLHHALGINDVRRTEQQNGIKFFLEEHFEKIFLPFSLIDRQILHPLILIQIYLYMLFFVSWTSCNLWKFSTIDLNQYEGFINIYLVKTFLEECFFKSYFNLHCIANCLVCLHMLCILHTQSMEIC